MASPSRLSVFDFLSVSININSINDQKLAQLRLNDAKAHSADGHDEKTLKNIAEQLNLLDDPVNLQHLKICLTSEDDFDAKMKLTNIYMMCKPSLIPGKHMELPDQPKKEIVAVPLPRLICYIHVKHDQKLVTEFIEKFLLQQLINRRHVNAT